MCTLIHVLSVIFIIHVHVLCVYIGFFFFLCYDFSIIITEENNFNFTFYPFSVLS